MDPREFSDWDTLYKETNVEEIPWYEKDLDPDLEHEIKTRNFHQGRFLDLSTGPNGGHVIVISPPNLEFYFREVSNLLAKGDVSFEEESEFGKK